MVLLDTSVLVDGLTENGRLLPQIVDAMGGGERLAISTMVLYEWLRGPRAAAELEAQETLFPSHAALPFETAEAEIAARIYRSVKRPRGRYRDRGLRHPPRSLSLDGEYRRFRRHPRATPAPSLACVLCSEDIARNIPDIGRGPVFHMRRQGLRLFADKVACAGMRRSSRRAGPMPDRTFRCAAAGRP